MKEGREKENEQQRDILNQKKGNMKRREEGKKEGGENSRTELILPNLCTSLLMGRNDEGEEGEEGRREGEKEGGRRKGLEEEKNGMTGMCV